MNTNTIQRLFFFFLFLKDAVIYIIIDNISRKGEFCIEYRVCLLLPLRSNFELPTGA